MALIKILIDTGSASYSELDNLQSRKESLPKVINYLKAVNSGAESATITVNKVVLEATATLNVGGTGVANNETFDINGETFTFKTSGVTGYTGAWIEPSATDTSVTADNIVSAVNNLVSEAVEGVVTAAVTTSAAAASVVTLTFDEGGRVGNAITTSETATDFTVAQGVTGTDGTSTTLTTG